VIGDASDAIRRATLDGKFIALVGVGQYCVVIGNRAGEFNGWFDPCHGGHFDTSGRIRKGPAFGNLPLPIFELVDARTLMLFPPDPKWVPKHQVEKLLD
jgi:ubiquinol-cytochrome c reductase iron-sulfur subunit